MGIAVVFRCASQGVVGIQVQALVRRVALLQADEIVEVDIVQIEFEVVIVIVNIVEEYRSDHGGSVQAAKEAVDPSESLRIHAPSHL